jgi:hypothetical protein
MSAAEFRSAAFFTPLKMNNPKFHKPTIHSMKRRSLSHDYSYKGYYHITITTTKTLRQPLGQMAGQLEKPDGDSDAPHVALSPIGKMVEEELKESIHKFYPMLEVQDYVIMPEHLHFLLVAHSNVVSKNGKSTHLGHVIAGFKYGCNKRYWAMAGKATLTTESSGTSGAPVAHGSSPALGDSVAKSPSPSSLPPLFDPGYCDVMPVDSSQLSTQRAYIHANPRSRLLRMTNRSSLYPQRHTVDTAVTIPALHGYLQRECPQQLTPESFSAIGNRLLQQNGHVMCDSYGKIELLHNRLLPVVCHRKDAKLFHQQKARCLAEAASGAILVSARISKGEQEIMDTALLSGYPVIRIEDNGFPDIYHPSADRMDDCAAGHLLLLTPWSYQFRGHDDGVTTAFCKTMNCVAQAICRKKDCWWK